MLTELAIIDKSVSKEELTKFCFTASSRKINSLCVPSGLLNKIISYKDYFDIVSLIDYPAGLADTSLRQHEILFSINSGANIIDLTINNTLLQDHNLKKIMSDLMNCLKICRQHKIELRPIIEYRLFEQDYILDLCKVFNSFGVSVLINSTGIIGDNTSDNILISQQIMKKGGIDVISCGRIWTKQHYELFQKINVYGIRFTSLVVAENVLGKFC